MKEGRGGEGTGVTGVGEGEGLPVAEAIVVCQLLSALWRGFSKKTWGRWKKSVNREADWLNYKPTAIRSVVPCRWPHKNSSGFFTHT